MSRIKYLPLTLLLLAPLLAEEKPKPEAGFVPLFDGKTLDGWVPVNAAPETFSVKDGMLVTTGLPTGLLRTARRYENFILEAEWMHVKPKGNSGIFVWADPLPAVGSPFTRAIEVQVLDGTESKNYTSHGDLFSIWGAKFTPDRPHPSGWERCLPGERRSKPAGEWNHYRVECNDGVIKLAVNGKVVSGGSKSRPRMGYICIEAEGSECRFKNLKIKELPSTKPKDGECCPEASGHRTLFTGLDLRGWKTDDEKAWKVDADKNVLRYVGEKGGKIRTEKEYGPCEVVFDLKLGPAVGVSVAGKRAELAEVGKWKRHVVRVEKGKGPVVLTAEAPCDFCNLFIRELK